MVEENGRCCWNVQMRREGAVQVGREWDVQAGQVSYNESNLC